MITEFLSGLDKTGIILPFVTKFAFGQGFKLIATKLSTNIVKRTIGQDLADKLSIGMWSALNKINNPRALTMLKGMTADMAAQYLMGLAKEEMNLDPANIAHAELSFAMDVAASAMASAAISAKSSPAVFALAFEVSFTASMIGHTTGRLVDLVKTVIELGKTEDDLNSSFFRTALQANTAKERALAIRSQINESSYLGADELSLLVKATNLESISDDAYSTVAREYLSYYYGNFKSKLVPTESTIRKVVEASVEISKLSTNVTPFTDYDKQAEKIIELVRNVYEMDVANQKIFPGASFACLDALERLLKGSGFNGDVRKIANNFS